MPADKTMRAALLTEYGAPLEVKTVARPSPRAGEILVKIEASGVCFTDVHIHRGDHASPNPLPLIMGHEGVGQVVEVGTPDGRFNIGDRVGIGYVYSACGHCRECHTGGENYCADFDATGYSVSGCFAEYVCLRQDWATAIPNNVSAIEAAPLMCAGSAAYASLKKIGLKAGDTVAIFGLGGLGQYAIQIAKQSGMRVIAVDVDQDKLDTAQKLGADEVVVANIDSIVLIKALGGADGCVNFAPVGATWPLMLAVCKPRAKIVLTAVPADQLAFYAHELIERGLQVIGSSASNRQEMSELLQLAANGKIKGVISTRSLDEVNIALADLQAGKAAGRTVLDFH